MSDYEKSPHSSIFKERNLRGALEKLPEERTPQECQLLEEVLMRVRILSQLSPESRGELAKSITYKVYPARHIIFHQGEEGSQYYIIRSGSVTVSTKDSSGQERILATLFNHDGFGELALMKDGPKERRRGATVTAREATEVFIVQFPEYERLLKPVAEKDLKEKMDFLANSHILKSLSMQRLQSLAYLFLQKEFPTNSIIVQQGEDCEKFYFIASGSCRIIKALSAKPDPSNSGEHDKEHARTVWTNPTKESGPVSPDSGNGTCVDKKKDETLYLDLGMLNSGDFFGEEAFYKRSRHSETISSVGAVTLYFLNKNEFLKRIDKEVLQAIGIYGRKIYPDAELLQLHRKARKWETFKKDLVQSVIDDKRRRRNGSFTK